MEGSDPMIITQLKQTDELTNLPFARHIEAHKTDPLTFLIKDAGQIIGFIKLQQTDQNSYQLTKFVINQPDNPEQVLDLFYHILAMVEKKGARALLVETDQAPLIELLTWLGFKQHAEGSKRFVYTY